MSGSPLGEEWVAEADGIPGRQGARLLLLDAADNLLLMRAHDWGMPERTWWFLPGGGILPGEDPDEAAVRELLEETGIALSPGSLWGPVARRVAVFEFKRVTCRQYETFFFARYDGVAPPASGLLRDGWEADYLDGARWWGLDELKGAQRRGETIYPNDLVDLTSALRSGWDGTVRTMSPH